MLDQDDCFETWFEMTPAPPNVTELLRAWTDGDREAQDQLFRAVYNELHRQAARYLRREQAGLSLQTTDLIHEAYVRLVDVQHVEWRNSASPLDSNVCNRRSSKSSPLDQMSNSRKPPTLREIEFKAFTEVADCTVAVPLRFK